MNPAFLSDADWDGLIWLVERAAVGCVHSNESRWAARLRDDAKKLKAQRLLYRGLLSPEEVQVQAAALRARGLG